VLRVTGILFWKASTDILLKAKNANARERSKKDGKKIKKNKKYRAAIRG